jgi:hypothetical protein
LPAGAYIQTHIKQVQTTAPRDMKAAKEARVRGKADAKARRSQKREAAVSAKKYDGLIRPVLCGVSQRP